MPDQPFINLDTVVINALNLHSSYTLPTLDFGNPKKRLVVASGNACATGRILFHDQPDTIVRDESWYECNKDDLGMIDGAVVISATGKKHGKELVEDLLQKGIDTYLLTCNRDSPAGNLLDPQKVIETKSLEEDITYNTSTYLGMVLAKTREDPAAILQHIAKYVNPPKNLGGYDAFYMIVPPEFSLVKEMLLTKFDELFGGIINGRDYTPQQTMHAKTVVPSESEMFISFGYRNGLFGKEHARWDIPLFKGAGFAAMIAIGYFAIGNIQSHNPPYFHESKDAYRPFQEQLFQEKFFDDHFKRFEV